MSDVVNDLTHDESESRRSSTPANAPDTNKWRTEPIDICTDCFFLLQQIRKKARQRHIIPSTSFNRSHLSSSRSTSNYNLSSSSSASSMAAILAQQQNTIMIKSNSIQANLKQAKSAQELSANNDPLQTLTTVGATGGSQRVSLSRRHLFLKLQPAYDMKLNNIKTG
jgi:hypothetical protein